MKIEKNITEIIGKRRSFVFNFTFNIRLSILLSISNFLQVKNIVKGYNYYGDCHYGECFKERTVYHKKPSWKLL